MLHGILIWVMLLIMGIIKGIDIHILATPIMRRHWSTSISFILELLIYKLLVDVSVWSVLI